MFVSSHLMSEMAVTADQIIVIGRGTLITQGSVDELTANAGATVRVRASDNDALRLALDGLGATTQDHGGALIVSGVSCEEVGRAAFGAGIAVLELTPERASLEEVFMELTADSVQYGSRAVAPRE